jgi:8-oxo-dGTP pyrophosphatase MutT (NUDIX family)
MEESLSKNAIFDVSLKAIIKDDQNRILLLKMPDISQMAGYYDLPGGRIQEFEKTMPVEQILQRELIEEIGPNVKLEIKEVPVSVGRNPYISRDTGKEKWIFSVFFEAKYLGGEVVISDEHIEYCWQKLDRDNLSKLFVGGFLEGMTGYITGEVYKRL